MLGKQDHTNNRLGRMGILCSLLATALIVMVGTKAMAERCDLSGTSSQTLRSPLIMGASTAAPGQAAFPGQPPPIGSGPTPMGVHPGDLGGPSLPPSGFHDPTHGNIFPTRTGPDTEYPGYYQEGAGRYQTQNGQQQGVMWGGPSNGEGLMDPNGPRPFAEPLGPGGPSGGEGMMDPAGPRGDAEQSGGGGASGGEGMMDPAGPRGNAEGQGGGGPSGGKKYVNNGGGMGVGVVNNGGPRDDANKFGDRNYRHANQSNRFDFPGTIPTVRTFSRYLVILGVTAATVFVAMAAMSVVLGGNHGGTRVIGAVGGLLLLLGGYTIWKIVQMNTFHGNSTNVWSMYRNGQTQPMNPRQNPNPQGPFAPPSNPDNFGPGPGPGGGGGNFGPAGPPGP